MLTATDNSNMTASASVTIIVKAANDAPTAADDTAHTRNGIPVVIDVAANDTDAESDIDLATLSVVTPPAAGEARGRGGAVVYTAAAAGYDVFVYRVCDRARQCDFAEVTVIAAADR